MKFGLLQAIRSVYLVDSHSDRQEFFELYVSRRFIARIILAAYNLVKKTYLSAFIFCIFGFRVFLKSGYKLSKIYKILAPSDYINEERAIQNLLNIVDDQLIKNNIFDIIIIKLKILFKLLFKIGIFYKITKFLKFFEVRGNFLTCCRISETIWYYVLSDFIIKITKSNSVAVASNYSPSSCALMAAARKNTLPIIYTAHSIVPIDFTIPKLEATLVCLYGPKALQAFDLHQGIEAKKIVYIGLAGKSAKIKIKDSFNAINTVGIFLTSHFIEENFHKLIKDLSNHANINSIIIRPHPLKDANPDLSKTNIYPKVIIDAEGTAQNTASKCDLVVAGSSSVHIEVLKSGIPTLYYEDFDTVGPDYYNFIKDKIVLEINDYKNITWDKVKNFYNHDWISRFQELDSMYLKDISEKKAELKKVLKEIKNV